MLQDLIEQAEQTLRLPEIIGERCVHSHIENASCRSCVDVCPKDAWLLDDEQLGINPETCDGCGICAAVCTEGAILHNHEPVVGHWQDRILALIACEKTESSMAEVIPCVHALGLHNLLALYRQGCRYLFISTGECSRCPRGEATSIRDRVGALNSMLEQRGLMPLQFKQLAVDKWQRIEKTLSTLEPQETVTRRNFLRRSVADVVDKSMQYSRLQDVEKAEFIPVGEIIPWQDKKDILPYVVQIDPRKCNGCDACARLCPHEAISLVEDEGKGEGTYFLYKSQSCTGCRICIDACDQDAVHVDHWAAQVQSQLPLTDKKCSACHVSFHLPTKHSSGKKPLCQICTKVNHNKNLFQVLE